MFSIAPRLAYASRRTAPAVGKSFPRMFTASALRMNEKAEAAEESKEEQLPESLEEAHTRIRELTDLSKQSSEKLEQHQKIAAELKDARLRVVADFENLQKITEKEKKNARDYALTKFSKELVTAIDILDLAIKSVPEAHLDAGIESEVAKQLRQLHQGVAMTRSEITNILRRHGVTAFDPKGEPFDPNVHEAVFQVPIPGHEPGTVLETQEIGYKINDRLLRPAKVGIVAEQ